MAPAGMHRARWMAKAIYAIKLWMFYDQFPLTKKEEQGMRDVAIFVVHVYLKTWFRAPLSASAPNNDLQLLKILYNYKTINASVAAVGIKKMSGHLWYFAEQPVALAFFDQDTSSDTKRRMVQALGLQGSTEIRKRATVDEEDIQQYTLD
jgi:hypothetical protein